MVNHTHYNQAKEIADLTLEVHYQLSLPINCTKIQCAKYKKSKINKGIRKKLSVINTSIFVSAAKLDGIVP